MLRRLPIVLAAIVVVLAAFSTGLPFLFYVLYLGILVGGGAYIVTRLGLSDLEAGYAVSQLHGHVGEQLRVTYTMRNAGRVPKLLLEVHNPTSLPGGLPGRAISLGPNRERSWLVRAPLTRRGHFRVEPLQIRTGDPFGFFESSAAVGQGVTVVVYPRIERLPFWRLPAADLEGSHASPQRTHQTTPLAMAVRPWAPGDSMNRIHWKTTARHGEIQVKEFDLEQTADAWIFLDLERTIQAGRGDESTTEAAIRVAAAVTDRAILENRAVGLTVNAHRASVLPADRGSRQHLKIMQLLAAVDADGATPLSEALISGLGRVRRGMTAVIITASLERDWVRLLGTLRIRGIGCVVVLVDAPAYAHYEALRHLPHGAPPPETDEEAAQRARALRHALAEYELRTMTVLPAKPLAELLVA